MKLKLKALIAASAVLLTGCASGINTTDDMPENSAYSEQSDRDILTREDTAAGTSESSDENAVVLSEETEKYSARLSYSVLGGTGGETEISPASLEIIPKGDDALPALRQDLLLGVSRSDDRLVVCGEPQLDVVELSDWNVAAVRVPCRGGGEIAHEVSFYYFDDSTLQLLGFNRFKPVIPADGKIEADADNNCFSFVDTEGNPERYTVVYDEYETTAPYCLRSAELSPEPVILTHDSECGQLSFSYTVYGQDDDKLIISAHNFVEFTDSEGNKHTCEMYSPVYQPAMSFDGLTRIEAPIEFEAVDFADWGAAAVRVPHTDPLSGEISHVVSLYYYDGNTLQLLGDGYFTPEIPADSKIEADADANSFSLTNKDGTAEWYTPVRDPDDEQHIKLQPVTP